MMIDWVSARIPLAHTKRICNGRVVSLTKDGEIVFDVAKFLPVKGSHSSTIQIRSLHTGPDGEISFSGNPVKFLQGHNLYGSSDVVAVMADTLERVFAMIKVRPSTENRATIRAGQYDITRVDITTMYELPTLTDVLAWIRAAAHASRSRHKSGGILRGDTLYWGKHSRRWAIKAYAKGQEVMAKGHELPQSLPKRDELIAWAQNKLRLELTLRSPELKQQRIHTAAALGNVDMAALFRSYREKIVIPDNFTLSSELLHRLPNALRSTYVLWERGEDVRGLLSKNTFYRHRRGLLEHGVDISVRYAQGEVKTVSLMGVLETSVQGGR